MKPIIVCCGLCIFWYELVSIFSLPSYILPTPLQVIYSLYNNTMLLWNNALITISEIMIGLLLGIMCGISAACFLIIFPIWRPWFLPCLLITQALPTFAIAPILILWFGYGIFSKIIMTAFIIFFPITICCYDGLQKTNRDIISLAYIMGASRLSILKYIRWFDALPVLASGLRVAVVSAPIGAVISEWVGSESGLGYMMLQDNARLMTDRVFAALFVLAFFSIILYFTTDTIMRHIIPWYEENKH